MTSRSAPTPLPTPRVTRVQTTNDTVYYFVITDCVKVKSAVTWTGYKNAPSNTDLADGARLML